MTGNDKIHTRKFDQAVKDIKESMKQNHYSGNAYAIAEHSLGYKASILKSHRRK